jgi:3-oxoacyl-[acyl-carrier-protein] synthase II
MRRVVVTGLGIVSPLGTGVETTWSNMLAGKSGAGPITRFDASDLPTRIAFEVKEGDGSNGTLKRDDWIDPKDQRRYDDFIQYALIAAKQAMKDSGLELKTEEERYRAGVLVGSGIGGLTGIQDTTLLMKEKGPRRVSPFFIPGSLINLAGGLISINFGLKGPNHAVVTACATGTHAIGDAARIISPSAMPT